MEIKIFLTWYLMFLLFGIIGLPIANLFFHQWRDRGYGMAKLLGLFCIAMPVWLLASLKIVPFTRVWIIFVFLAALIASIYWIYKNFADYKKVILLIVFEEAIFLINLLIWTYIRGFNARAEGTEKMMNTAFMNSIFRSQYFPPLDPWFSGGSTINYYYLGHYLFAFVGKLSGIAIAYVYNYALVTITSHAFISLFSILSELLKKANAVIRYILAGLGSFWICYGGNVHYLFYLLDKLFHGGVNIFYPHLNNVSGQVTYSYFFPDATRIIPFAIDEFPAYSIVLGDVHGHYLGFPFFIIAIAIGIALYNLKHLSKKKLVLTGLASIFVWVLYGINSWDFITINVFFLLIHLVQSWQQKLNIKQKIVFFLTHQAMLILPGLLFMIAYLVQFHAPVVGTGSGINKYLGFVPAYAYEKIEKGESIMYQVQNVAKGNVTDPVYWSEFYKKRNVTSTTSPIKMYFMGKLYEDFPQWLLMWGMFLFITLGYLISRTLKATKANSDRALLNIMVILSVGLVLGVEFFFLKDIFHASNAPYFRTNTIFKFYYHAWVIWGIACTWMIGNILQHPNLKKLNRTIAINVPIILITFLLFIGSAIYIHKAVIDFYPLKSGDANWTMNGMAFIQKDGDKVGDFGAINWLNENVSGQPVIAEAVGDAYTFAARYSTFTGLPTVLGWPNHEWQWRGSSQLPYDRKNGVTSSDNKVYYSGIDALFTTTDINVVLELINRYDIKYIVIGQKERELYPNLNESLIPLVADKVYENDYNTRIYQVNPNK
ncbi:MAG: DUF2298 domain-containing protein [bacterium]